MSLQNVVPWGRSLAEYQAMFDLGHQDQQRLTPDCAAGPASFNAELSAVGGKVVSCDPIYQYSAAEIAARIEATYEAMLESVRENAGQFVWTRHGSPEGLGRARMEAMQRFLADFPA